MSRVKESMVNMYKGQIMHYLVNNPSMPVGQMAAKMQVSQGYTSALLKNLVEEGLVLKMCRGKYAARENIYEKMATWTNPDGTMRTFDEVHPEGAKAFEKKVKTIKIRRKKKMQVETIEEQSPEPIIESSVENTNNENILSTSERLRATQNQVNSIYLESENEILKAENQVLKTKLEAISRIFGL